MIALERAMGPELLAEVNRQLLADLEHYGLSAHELAIDWTNAETEGHCTDVLGGRLESASGVCVVDSSGETVAEGWIDFVHGGDDQPLYVFWHYLTMLRDKSFVSAKSDSTIPDHVWQILSDHSKNLCATRGKYDARWADDPKVLNWTKKKRKR